MTEPSSTLPRRRCRIPRLSRSSSDAAPRPKSTGGGGVPSPWGLPDPDLGSAAGSVPFSLDDDGSSVKSFGSFLSYASQATTEASRPASRCHFGKRYAVHCERPRPAGGRPEEYLTPTQRRERELRQLRAALARQERRARDKELEAERLARELRELRDALAQMQDGKLMSSSQESDSLIAKNSASEISFDATPDANDDSGLATSSSVSPGDSSDLFDSAATASSPAAATTTAEKAVCTADDDPSPSPAALRERASLTEQHGASLTEQHGASLTEQQQPPRDDAFLATYRQELESLKAQHREHYQDLKERFTERVDDLLQKLTDANARYLELRPLFERAQDKIVRIEGQLGEVQRDLEGQEEYHSQMYLQMYRKGQESAARERQEREREDEEEREQGEALLDFSGRSPRRVSVPDLLRQLQALERELEQTRQLVGDRQAEYTLRFLKDAVFYFLTKRDKEHLKAVQSILGFTEAERTAVAKAMKHRRL